MNEIFNNEEKHLDIVKDKIVEEKKYYEKELEEIPKRHTKALQGDSFLVESLMSEAAKRLRNLSLAEDSPYFGCIEFLTDGENEVARVYVGKTTIMDDNNQQLTTDWRSPICSLYYDGNVGRVSYEAPKGTINGDLKLKRQIIIKDGKLIDVLDTNLVTNDELLQPYLSINADNKMKTIIASIQKEQNQIIRKPISHNFIVQGVAGSGKTSVALHRIAYLAYNLGENIKTNQILALAPNKYFIDYVSSVLPELEVDPVDQKTYLELLNTFLGEKYTLNFQGITGTKNINLFSQMQSLKSSLEYKEGINKFMVDYFNNKLNFSGIVIDGKEIYSGNLIKKLLIPQTGFQLNYENALKFLIRDFKERREDIYTELNKKYRDIYIKLPKGDPIRNEAVRNSSELYEFLKIKGEKVIKDYFKKSKIKPMNLYLEFISNIEEYMPNLTNDCIEEIKNDSLKYLNMKKVSFEDMPALLYINYLLTGKTLHYKHVVVDEAQDYGLFHFDMLKKLLPNSTFSIYGDLAQSIYSYRSINDWESVVDKIFDGNCDVLNLDKSYRTTMQITNNANLLLNEMNLKEAVPVVRHGNEVMFSEKAKNDEYKVNKINEWLSKDYKSIALICKNDKEAKKLCESLRKKGLDIIMIGEKDEEYKGGVFTISAAQSKGLEFDAVMINDASNNIYSSDSNFDMHLLYVACTRALHEMEILYNKELCHAFSGVNVKNELHEEVKKMIKKK